MNLTERISLPHTPSLHPLSALSYARLARRRLMKEHKEITKGGPKGVLAGPIDEDNYLEWEAVSLSLPHTHSLSLSLSLTSRRNPQLAIRQLATLSALLLVRHVLTHRHTH